MAELSEGKDEESLPTDDETREVFDRMELKRRASANINEMTRDEVDAWYLMIIDENEVDQGAEEGVQAKTGKTRSGVCVLM